MPGGPVFESFVRNFSHIRKKYTEKLGMIAS